MRPVCYEDFERWLEDHDLLEIFLAAEPEAVHALIAEYAAERPAVSPAEAGEGAPF